MFKRIFSLLVVITITLSIAACGAGGDDASSFGGGGSTDVTASNPTIDIAVPSSGPSVPADTMPTTSPLPSTPSIPSVPNDDVPEYSEVNPGSTGSGDGNDASSGSMPSLPNETGISASTTPNTQPADSSGNSHQCIFKEVGRTEGTCVQKGSIEYRCECGSSKTQSVGYGDHQYNPYKQQASTTTVAGYEIFICIFCDDERRTELPLLSVVDSDMCGTSLLGEVLPHSQIGEIADYLMNVVNNNLGSSAVAALDYNGKFPLPSAFTASEFKFILTNEYQYLFSVVDCWVYQTPNESVRFAMSPGGYEVLQRTYAEVYRILDVLGINQSTTKKVALERINNYICEAKFYDYDLNNLDIGLDASVFNEGGVCHNYAILFQLLCLGCGIECEFYSCEAMNHAWNKVIFSDGSYLWVDTTWNDAQFRLPDGSLVEGSVENGISEAAIAKARTQFFLLTTEKMKETHTFMDFD